MTYETLAYYYFEVNGVEGELEMVLTFDYQPEERATYWEPGCGASLTLCSVTMKDGSPIDPLVADCVADWAQNYLDENTYGIIKNTIES